MFLLYLYIITIQGDVSGTYILSFFRQVAGIGSYIAQHFQGLQWLCTIPPF